MKDTNTLGGRIAPDVPVRKQVSDAIRQAILDFRLRPGERLVERELVEMTNASRTSVREALRELEAEGLVQRTPYRRLIVAIPSAAEVVEIFEVRGLMLGVMVRHFVANATEADLTALMRAYEDCPDGDDASTERMVATKQALYDVLARYTVIANAVMENLGSRIVLFRQLCAREPGRQSEWKAEVGRIVDAVLQRDREAALTACEDHVAGATAVVLRVLEKYPGFSRTN